MAMSEELGGRYRALFAGYGAGGSAETVALKGAIAERAEMLRADAMYFLVVNLDHMVIRALSGYVPGTGGRLIGEPMAAFETPERAASMAQRALDVVMKAMESRPRPPGGYSANDAIRALALSTEDIAAVVLWWREDG